MLSVVLRLYRLEKKSFIRVASERDGAKICLLLDGTQLPIFLAIWILCSQRLIQCAFVAIQHNELITATENYPDNRTNETLQIMIGVLSATQENNILHLRKRSLAREARIRN